VHGSVAARRVTEGAGLERIGSRIRAATERAIEEGVRRGFFGQRGPFLWAVAMTEAPVRDRSALRHRAQARYPLEGRSEQAGVSVSCHLAETPNSGKEVQWSCSE
jgi:hypothetical protein